MPPGTGMRADRAEARAFADSVAGVLDRHAPAYRGDWTPGEVVTSPDRELSRRLDQIGWGGLAGDRELVACAGLGAVELGRRLAPVREVDRLLGGGPMSGELVRSLGVDQLALAFGDEGISRRHVVRSEPVASAEGLEVWRVLELGQPSEPVEVDPGAGRTAIEMWIAALVGYLAGLGEGALELTAGYARQRRAFGSTLAGLAPVQQLLADAATSVRGVRLLAGEGAGPDALAHSGTAVAGACAACQQVSGAIGFTLEYPLHRYTQRARGLAAWSDALLGSLLQSSPPAIAR
jgi:butyryl-CoA dehydrogenase